MASERLERLKRPKPAKDTPPELTAAPPEGKSPRKLPDPTPTPPQGGSGTAKPSAKPPQKPKHDRLPAGSEKHLTWDGQTWHGTMSIPGIPEAFWFEARNEINCFRGLDSVYRKYLKEHKNEVGKGVGGGGQGQAL